MKKSAKVNSQSHFKKILIVQTAFIGDVILATPLARVVAEKFPDSQVHFLTIPASRQLVENLPYLHRLWIFDKRGEDTGLGGLWRLAASLRREKFDLAIVPHRSLRSAALVFLARIPCRVGFNRSSGSFLFTHRIRYSYQHHEIERNLHLLKPLIQSGYQIPLPDIVPDREDQERIQNWLESRHIRPGSPMVCLAPGSIWPTKRWPAPSWGELADLLARKHISVLLIGSRADRILLDEITAKTTSLIHIAMGEFTLRQSAELIRLSQLLISNDSAPTHMGVAVRTPVLTIFGSTVPAFGFYPYGRRGRVAEVQNLDCRPCTDHGRNSCPLQHFHCMLQLTPTKVFDIAWQMIHENN